MGEHDLPLGQQQARTRWGTHASGAAFDKKKTSYLTEESQAFIAQQAICVIAGPDPQDELMGLLALGEPGFVLTPDMHTCLLPLDSEPEASPILLGLRQAESAGKPAQLGLFFICHPTRERLCVQGTAELLQCKPPGPYYRPTLHKLQWVRLHVQRAFFHCAKYIRTRVTGLTAPVSISSEPAWRPQDLRDCSETHLTQKIQAFIDQQVLGFLCTMDQEGQCAVNHRGGAPGFLVTLPADAAAPGGTVLLPDYAGNGAFEAIGNILETGKAALVVPNYAAQLALCISGSARVLELEEMPAELARKCIGAERVVALSVQRVEAQSGDWSAALAYERARAEVLSMPEEAVTICPV